jgi:hypothetical protein
MLTTTMLTRTMLTRTMLTRTMLTKSKIALSAAMILAAAVAASAKDNGIPKLDLQKLCQAEGLISLGGNAKNDFDSCLSTEEQAYDQLVKNWATFPAPARGRCVQPMEYQPSYVEWLTCLEMERDVKKMRDDQGAPTSDGQSARGTNQ